MDPKLSNLDPKLQDAYNRVMSNDPSGQPSQNPQPIVPQEPVSEATMPPPIDPDPNLNPTPFGNSEPATQPQPSLPQEPTLATEIPVQPIQQPQYPTTPMPQPAVAPPPPQATVKVNEAPTEQMPIQTPMPSPAVTSTVAFNASDGSKNIGTSPIKKGGLGGMLPILVGIGIVFLLVAYTFVWIVIFNFEVPIISEFL